MPEPHSAHYGVLPVPPPEDNFTFEDKNGRHRVALAQIAKVDVLASELGDPYLISRLLTRREAVTSSSIEGTHSTLDELLRVEEDDETAGDAARQVGDYALTLDRFIPQARAFGPELFTTGLICDLHAEAMRRDPDYRDRPGDLRSAVVWIGGNGQIAYSTFNPPPPEDVPASLEENARYMRCEGMQAFKQTLIVRMALAHAHFEAIHPFRDGNGRVGRLLLPLMMAADHHTPLYLSAYIEANKTAYIDALKAAQQRLEWAALIDYLSSAVIATVDELFDTRRALMSLAVSWKQRRRFRANSAAERSLVLLRDYPVITAKRLANKLEISVPAATTAVEQLQDAGILTERTGYRRNRIYVAAEVLSILNRPFGSSPFVNHV
ncbi:Fic family protein [Asticcacaulis sp. W401b]|uniref:Fic family protein n=1 Tax=Asticcacaulis sp. W401b TaxID=3388666 RepID=UPI003970E332